MATEKRTSEQGNVFDVDLVRNFLLTTLGHDAVIDEVDELIGDHVLGHKYHPSVIAASLKPIVEEVLDVATSDDWAWIARTLTQEACEALEVEYPPNRATEAQPPQTSTETRRALRDLDPGELREKLAETYTHDPVSLSATLRVWWIIRRISQLTGINRERIKADAKTDAEAIRATRDDNTSRTDQSSEHTDTPTSGPSSTKTAPGKYLITVRLKDNGEPRTIAVTCEADSSDQAEQIAADVNDYVPSVDILATRRISELQIIHPLAYSRGGLTREEGADQHPNT
jgi:hypothetical protein